LLHAATMRLASKPGAPPERLWNLVKQEAVVKAPGPLLAASLDQLCCHC